MAHHDQQAGQAKKERLSIYVAPETLGRIRAAAPFGMAFGGHPSMSEWVAAVIEREVESLETKVNNGNPFDPVGPGETVSTGRTVKPPE